MITHKDDNGGQFDYIIGTGYNTYSVSLNASSFSLTELPPTHLWAIN